METTRQGGHYIMIIIEHYIRDFTDRAEELSDKKIAECPEASVRIKQVEDMLEQYYLTVGKYPKPAVLDHLGSYILVNELKDKDVDKVTNTEFPILSPIQIKRRHRRQMLMQDSTIDFLNTKYNKQLDSLAKTQVKKVDY